MRVSIEYRGVNIDVEFDYTPSEPMVMYYIDGSGHPGSSAEVYIESVKVGGVDVYDLLEDKIEEIEDLIINKYEQEYYEER